MASEIDICNLALSHLGDTATVSNLNPPEGSAQAEHCARFYPISRDSLLEMHTWNFATRRAQLAQIEADWAQWKYAYVAPSDALQMISVLAPDAASDYSVSMPRPFSQSGTPDSGLGMSTPQDFVVETDEESRTVIYTNQENAILRYTARVSDPTRFSPLFIEALTWSLAAKLAGPVIKGDAGQAEAKRCLQMMTMWLGQARVSDSGQRQVKPQQAVSWMNNR